MDKPLRMTLLWHRQC